MFLSHFAGGTVWDWLDQPLEELMYWHNEAVKLWNEINRTDD